jgi:asparagine synthase (glutamine-hydrolysing)
VLGEYSVAIFDQASGELLLTHDSLGLVPMFYRMLQSGLVFGSHLEDLVGENGRDELDEEYVADYVADCFYSPERTPYRSIKRLAFGESIVCNRSGIVERHKWNFDPPPLALREDREYEEQFVSLLSGAVAGASRAHGPVWSELSGGLDSSSVTGIAARMGVETLEAISLVYDRYSRADESQWMRTVIECYPMPWNRIDGDDLLPFLVIPDRFLAEPGLPMIDWSWRQRYEEIVSQRGVAAVLTGQGGDFVLFGIGTEPYYLADLARTLKLSRLAAELANWRAADRRKRSWLYWFTNYVSDPLLNYMSRPPRGPGRRPTLSPWISAAYARKMALDERAGRTAPNHYRSIEHCWFVDGLIKLCGRIANLNQSPEKFEFRHPLLHRPLVEFMFALPSNQKLSPGGDRFLQRRALKSILPESLRQRRDKMNFDQPFYEGLRESKSWTRLLTVDSQLVQRGIVDAPRWAEAVAQAKLGRTHSLAQFQAAATLEIWLRQAEGTIARQGAEG